MLQADWCVNFPGTEVPPRGCLKAQVVHGMLLAHSRLRFLKLSLHIRFYTGDLEPLRGLTQLAQLCIQNCGKLAGG